MNKPRSMEKHKAKGNSKYSVKRRKKKITVITIVVIAVILLAAAGIWAFLRFHTYSDHTVQNTIEIANSGEHTIYDVYKKGFVRCANDGLTCFDKKDIIWAETAEMTQPVMDVCEGYIAVADLKGSDIYIYDEGGQVNRIALSHAIIDIEVSRQGVVAAATSEDASNYIEVLDKEGNELLTAKSVFSSSGYLTDIAISPDGSRLAAAFTYIGGGVMESKVVFYDLTGESKGDNIIIGGFNQYQDTLVMSVEFLDDSIVCAVGDHAITIYRVGTTPSIIYEDLDLNYEIQSLFYAKNRIGLVVEQEESEYSKTIKVLNERGKEIMDHGTDFAYSRAAFAGNNVLLYSNTECHVYSFAGIEKFSYTFEDRIEYMISAGTVRDYVLALPNAIEIIRLK